MRKMSLLLATAFSVLAGVALGYFVRRIERDVFRVKPGGDEPFDLEVEAVSARTVTLRPLTRGAAKDLATPGWFGLAFEGGYGRMGAILASDGHDPRTVTREFETVRGTLHEGSRARVDSFVFERDPRAAHGIEWEHVEIACTGGQHPAWLVEASLDRWVIFVHGKGARREEALRALPVVYREGWTCLAITYGNDVECPASTSGRYAYGAEEWEDLEAAVKFALERGAAHVVLAGYSMGGGIALSFAQRSELASLVRGLILDAPMTDLASLLRLRGRQNRLPAPVMAATLQVTSRRLRVDWAELDYHRNGEHAGHPILLFHGDQDDVIPVELSDRFAEARPDWVRYVRVAGAGHVRSWNVDRDRYETVLRDWLRQLI